MLPNFLVVGGQKCGTTSLHEYLSLHPDIYLPSVKETHFFADPKKYENGIEYYEKEYFSDWKGEPAVGEVDPDYIYIPDALERIRQHLDVKNLKIVLLVRNPVDRAFSHYLMTYRRGVEKESFENAIQLEHKRIKKGFYEREHFSYLDRGFYGRDVERFLNVFPSHNVMVLDAYEFRNNTLGCIRNVLDFIGVDAAYKSDILDKRFHEATVPRIVGLSRWLASKDRKKDYIKRLIPSETIRKKLRYLLLKINSKRNDINLSEETRNKVKHIYAEDIRHLEEQTGMRFSHWL